MKKNLLLATCIAFYAITLNAQVTQINNNNSLEGVAALSSTKAIVVSAIDSSLWVTDATLPGTVQIPTAVKYESFGFVLSGKFIFRGSTPSTGSEIYITDGTAGGTVIVKDIYPGATSSAPSDFSVLNGVLYFSARTAAEGRELWKTNGTLAGTSLVKDIVTGADSSNREGEYHLFSAGSYLLFAANTAANGLELWKSDGTNAGTVLLKDINTNNAGADSSSPDNFYPLGSTTLFTATDATHGQEVWKTDGTPGGTTLLKDINPNSAGFSDVELFPGFTFPIFFGFHTFNNHAYFQANDGTSTGELWSTDGTPGNTVLIKDIVPGTGLSFIFGIDGVNLSSKFIFPVSDGDGGTRSELWQSDGTPAGTVLFKSFTPVVSGDIPIVYIPYSFDIANNTYSQQLFQGSKFFFTARTPANGRELWISDGTVPQTQVVKDINLGSGDGVDTTGADYLYTTTTLFFVGNDGATGNELWKTDGTSGGTSLVKDINLNAADADPASLIVFNKKVVFTATDGDDPNARDLFVVDGTFTPLPVKLTDFIVSAKTQDALLQWSTQQEISTRSFTVQRSYDGQHFEDIGNVNAAGTSYFVSKYSFTDVGIMVAGKPFVYYRLRITDVDGKSVLSNVISLRIGGGNEWQVRLLSNPVQDYIRLIVSGKTDKLHLSVRDITGKLVYSKVLENISGQISLPVELQKGIYLLESENNNERRVIRFVK